MRGARGLPLAWLLEEILGAQRRHDRAVKVAVNALGAATGSYPSAMLRLARTVFLRSSL